MVVKADGADLDDLREMRFSHPGIAAVYQSDGRFSVTASNVPPGVYEARVVGRFGVSNPRPIYVVDRPSVAGASTNRSFAAAQEISLRTVVYGKTTANAADFFRFKAAKGQRIIFECLGEKIDTRMEPVLVAYGSGGRELERARIGGVLDFSAPADGEYWLKAHDAQFRGGEDFGYLLSVRTGPWIDFALPAAIERGAKSKVTLFGRNLSGGKISEFKVDGHALEQLEMEIEAPSQATASFLARRPADAATEAFEYRLAGPDGSSNPILIGLATAKPILEASANDRGTNAMPIEIPCEIQGQFFPKRDVDWFQFEAKKGDVIAVEVFSQRLGLGTDPFLLVERVSKNDKGEETISDVQEAYDTDTNAGGTEFNTTTRDPALRLEVKENGMYRVQVRDLFGETLSDPRRVYRLAIHKEAPSFHLAAYWPAPPSQNKDSKEVSNWGAFLRRGDSQPIRVLALRDHFGGDIELSAEGLPPGVTATPARIRAGVNDGVIILTSTLDAPAWTGPIRVVGKARIGEQELKRTARGGTIVWNVSDYNNEAVQSELTQELELSVSGAEAAPLAIVGKTVEVVAGGKVSIPISIDRRSEFNGALKFKALTDPAKEFEVDGKATNATFEIELDRSKFPPGNYMFPVYASSPGKYRRITLDEAKGIEAELKKLKDGLAAITEAPKKEAANNQIKALEARLQFKDLTATVYTTVGINVTAPPVAVAPK